MNITTMKTIKTIGFFATWFIFIGIATCAGLWLPFWKAVAIDASVLALGTLISLVYRPEKY